MSCYNSEPLWEQSQPLNHFCPTRFLLLLSSFLIDFLKVQRVDIILISVKIELHDPKETVGNILKDVGKRFPKGG